MMDFTSFAALEMYHAVLAEQQQDRRERKWSRLWRDLRRRNALAPTTITPAKPSAPPTGRAGTRGR